MGHPEAHRWSYGGSRRSLTCPRRFEPDGFAYCATKLPSPGFEPGHRLLSVKVCSDAPSSGKGEINHETFCIKSIIAYNNNEG